TTAPNANGVATVTVVSQDSGGTANGGMDKTTNTFTLTITPVNDPPVITLASNNVLVLEDAGVTAVPGFVTTSPGPANESAQGVTNLAVLSVSNPSLFSVQPTLTLNGTLTFTTASNANGVATVTIMAQDNGGTANGGTDTATNTFTLTVIPVNDPPVITLASNNVTVLEDAGVVTVPGFVTTSPGPGNESSQSVTNLTVLSVSNPSLFSVQPVLALNGSLTFTTATNANGSATVTIMAQDSGGTANGGMDKTTNTFTITITPVNDPPNFNLSGQVGGSMPMAVAYLKSTVGNPWGNTENESAMDTAFGPGNWRGYTFETVDVQTLLATNKFLFLEGSDALANALNAFLTANLGALQGWVSNGGSLFINAAPNKGGNINFGFGVTLNYDGATSFSGTASAAIPGHSIFNGPQSPVGTAWTGGYFSHGFLTGVAMTALITDVSNRVVLGELQAGRGNVLFGGMTTANFHSPQPQGNNLCANIIYYGASKANFQAGNTSQFVMEDAGPQTVTNFAINISPGPPDEATQTVTFIVTND
ncbi:MAG: Ig-like domain-containing protein, partial [Verrucomicrobiota bacterium]